MDSGAQPAAFSYVARVPMMAAALGFALGVVVERYIFHPPLFWVIAALLLGACAIVTNRRAPYVSYFAVLTTFVALGGFAALATGLRTSATPKIAEYTTGDPVVITGHLLRDGIIRKSGDNTLDESVDIDVEQVESATGAIAADGGVRLTLYFPRSAYEGDDAAEDDGEQHSPVMPQYRFGQRIRLTAKLRPPMNYRNPGAFDYVSYLSSQKVYALGSAKANTVEVLPGVYGPRWERWRMAARRSVLGQIHRVWPEEQAVLFDAMLIGEHAFLPRSTRDEFQRSGTFHILVVSGMNVGIFAMGLLWLLRRLRAKAWLSVILVLTITCCYALLTDLGAPILRSVLMIAAYQVTRLLYRGRAALNVVGVAALALLAWDPKSIFDPSFQLTFLSVAVIAGVAVPILERTTEPYRRALRRLFTVGYDQAFEPKVAQWRLDLRMIVGRVENLVGRRLARFVVPGVVAFFPAAFELVFVSALMQVALALPMAWYFHRLPARALAANLAVVPLTGALMPASVLAVASSYVSATAAAVPAHIASWALAGITGTVHSLGKSQVSDVRLATPTLVVALVAAIGIALAMLSARRRLAVAVAGLLVMCATSAVLLRPSHVQRREGTLEITAIDVGQGESLLLVTPNGKTLLLDSGGLLGFSRSEFDVGEDVTSSYLWSRGIDHLDAIAFSHPHSDHIGGMRAIVRNFHPKEVWFGAAVNNSGRKALLASCAEYGVQQRLRSAGERFEFGGVNFEVLSPASDIELRPRGEDDESMVLRASVGGTSALLPGDVHKKAEQSLLGRGLHADLLKVPHHGSATSTSPEFLAEVHPQFAVISSGRRNAFRHPRPEVIERLAASKVRTFRTDLFGPVTFYLDGKSVTPSVPR